MKLLAAMVLLALAVVLVSTNTTSQSVATGGTIIAENEPGAGRGTRNEAARLDDPPGPGRHPHLHQHHVTGRRWRRHGHRGELTRRSKGAWNEAARRDASPRSSRNPRLDHHVTGGRHGRHDHLRELTVKGMHR